MVLLLSYCGTESRTIDAMILILVQKNRNLEILNMRIQKTRNYVRAAMAAIGEANRVVTIAVYGVYIL